MSKAPCEGTQGRSADPQGGVFQRIKNNRITEGGSPVCKRFKKLCEVMSMFDVKVTEEQLRYAADMVE